MNRDNVHMGRNVRRFREMREMKQEALAHHLGDDWNQQKVSLLEQKETIEPAMLEQLSHILNMPIDAFRNLDEERAINIISSTFGDNAIGNSFNYGTMNFHPADKLIQLHDEKIALYERMLKEKDEMMAEMKRIIEKGK